MSRILKLASAALIALTLVGGVVYTLTLGVDASTTVAIGLPVCPGDPRCDEYDPQGMLTGRDQVAETDDSGQEDVYKKGSFDIAEVETGDPSQWGIERIAKEVRSTSPRSRVPRN